MGGSELEWSGMVGNLCGLSKCERTVIIMVDELTDVKWSEPRF